MIDYNKPIALFSGVKLVDGPKKCLILDLDRSRSFHIERYFYDFIMENMGKSINEIISLFPLDEQKNVQDHFDFLIENEMIFTTDNPDLFPDMDLSWDHPSEITNSVIDVKEDSNHDWYEINRALNELGTGHLEIRYFYSPSAIELNETLKPFLTSRLKSIQIILKYSPEIVRGIENISVQYKRISMVTFYNSPEKNSKLNDMDIAKFIHTPENLSITKCGQISENLMINNREFFAEAQQNNSCLNRKLSIGSDGYIRNCPSMKETFGKLKAKKIMDVVSSDEFKSIWKIKKDEIDTCKVCEFRYSCMDCRAHIKDPNNRYSKPSTCSYEPYEGTWGH